MAPMFADKIRKILSYILDKSEIIDEVDKNQILTLQKIIITNLGNAGNNLIKGSISFSGFFNILLIFVLSFICC